MLNPSYDFRLFDLPWFSPLQAQEFGADTLFSAGDPTSFVDYSIGRLSGAGSFATFFQGQSATAQAEAEAAAKRAELDRIMAEERRRGGSINILDILSGRTVRDGGSGPIAGSQEIVTDGQGTLDTSGSQKVADTFKSLGDFFKSLPAGSGVFLVAVVAIIFLLLFVRR